MNLPPLPLWQAWGSSTGSRDRGITSSVCSSRSCCHVLFQAIEIPDRGMQPTRLWNVVQQSMITPWSLSLQNPSHSPSPSCITEHGDPVHHFHWQPSIPALRVTLNQDTGELPESPGATSAGPRRGQAHTGLLLGGSQATVVAPVDAGTHSPALRSWGCCWPQGGDTRP